MASKKRCVIGDLAELDIQELINYIAYVLNDYKAASDLNDTIFDKVEQISVFPNCGEICDNIFVEKEKFRRILVHNYYIYYTYDDETVYIVRVIHHLRNIGSILK